jgi:hypothetical protein
MGCKPSNKKLRANNEQCFRKQGRAKIVHFRGARVLTALRYSTVAMRSRLECTKSRFDLLSVSDSAFRMRFVRGLSRLEAGSPGVWKSPEWEIETGRRPSRSITAASTEIVTTESGSFPVCRRDVPDGMPRTCPSPSAEPAPVPPARSPFQLTSRRPSPSRQTSQHPGWGDS